MNTALHKSFASQAGFDDDDELISQLSPGTPVQYAFDSPRYYRRIPSVVIIKRDFDHRAPHTKAPRISLAQIRDKMPRLMRPRKQFHEGIMRAPAAKQNATAE